MLNVTEKQAYEWVKTGHWDLKEFTEWFDAKLADSYTDGRNDVEYEISRSGD